MLSPRVFSHLESPLFNREVPPTLWCVTTLKSRTITTSGAAPPNSWILAPSLPFLRPFPVSENSTDPFHSGEHVINRVAASSYELCPDDFRDEITGQIEDLRQGCSFQATAKNRRHRLGQCLNLWTQRDTETN